MDTIKDKIVQWLLDEGLEVKSEMVPREAPVEWVLRVVARIPPTIAHILIQQPAAKKDQLVFTLGILISPDHKAKYDALDSEDKIKVITEVLKTAYGICPECIIVIQPDLINAKNILITKIAYHEKLDRALVADTIRKLSNILALISAVLNAELKVLPKPRKDESGYPTSFM
ncbi:MAG: DUF2299 family protein [Desulfurococcales archaeon]|nr:DUF2299 family protein [Desulfurococcales archaeon]